MGAAIGFAIGITVSVPFFLFQWMIVWQKQVKKEDSQESGKKLAWILIVQVLKLFIYALVLIAMSRTDTAHMLGAATGLFVGILANGIVSLKKGPRHGKEDR